MRFVLSALLVLAASLATAAAMRKPPDIELVHLTAHHNEDHISLDGRVSNTGEKAIETLTLAFDFLDSGGILLTTQKSAIEEDVLEPGKVVMFHFDVDAPPRAIKFRVNAFDGDGRELRVGGAGPFVIE
ncbi:MAG TPA: hypothetical protein VG672_15065 [Bryobacteraceae bacterium]|jgi:hypothetical protein|nr:hypothetical protein [Bryobacteraceae bacterium]